MPLSHIEVSVEINRPLRDVIAFVDDCNNDPLWQISVLESRQVSEGPAGTGTVYHVKEKFLGRVIEQDWKVTVRNEDGSYWAATASGTIPMETSMKFEATDLGIRIIRILNVDPGRFFKFASPVVAHIARRELETDFANLKELLESEE